MNNICQATIQDIPKIQTIINEIWPLTYAPLMSKEQLDYMMKTIYGQDAIRLQMEDLNHHYLLIYENNNVVGFAAYELNYRDENKLMMHKLYLHPSAKGKGIGKITINYLMTIVKKENQHSLRLQVLHTNTKAYEFYKHIGFEKTGEEYNVLNDDMGQFLDYVMEKKR